MALMVNVIAPYGKIFSDTVESITLPGSEGEFGVLDGHSDLLSCLKVGVIEINRKSQRSLIAINWGYAKIQAHQVDVLVDSAVLVGDTTGDIAEAITKAHKLLEGASNDRLIFSSVVSKLDSAVKGK
ncbi:ATP synthase F1 subunit epsilon [Helicobacter anatolicus]|uniref:ATP synthase F1 subunit epsilon n=1 Tax=Helicobacter anatolicus TaxID=2905874 RepID=UPI001E547D3E|nr:ATP synthase F1 subunit epsilon [Helicobacter anatolicus]MCE3037850.1 F0F1 ATP synthase subunit epsilon [Helicobacter anatolicus]